MFRKNDDTKYNIHEVEKRKSKNLQTIFLTQSIFEHLTVPITSKEKVKKNFGEN